MAKGKTAQKGKTVSDKTKHRSWPIVTPDICEKCELKCPAGVQYLSVWESKMTKGIACKKELYLQRIADGLHPYSDIPKLKVWDKKDE